MKKRKTPTTIPALFALVPVLILTSAIISGCDDSPGESEPAATLQTAPLQNGVVQVRVEGPAVLEPSMQRDIRTLVSGIILQSASEGQRVSQGEILATIDSRGLERTYQQAELALEQAKNETHRAQAGVIQAQSTLSDLRALYDRGGISASEVRAAETTLENARYSYESSRIKERQTSLALDSAGEDLKSAVIRAPFDGVVTQQLLGTGDLAGQNAVLLRFAHVDILLIRAEVDEYDISDIQTGMRVQVSSDVLGDETLQSRVESISPAAQIINNISIFSVAAFIENSQGLLRPGMSADMTIMIASDKGFVVPSKLVQTLRGRSYIDVWEDNQVVTKRIEIGANDGANTAVLSGLSEGDLIVLPPQTPLSLPGIQPQTGGSSIVPISIPGSGGSR